MVFEEIYKKYWQKVFRLCMGYVNNQDLAKDLTQEVFIKVWQQLPKFRNESSIGTWLFRIAVNICLRQIERKNKMPTSDLRIDIIDSLQLNIEEEVQFLYKCISELPEVERMIISLELEDVKQDEIAKIIGISSGNVRVKIHRIKEKLTQKFKQNEC